MEEPGRLQSMGSLGVGHDWGTSLSLSLLCIGEGNGNPLQWSCLENPRDGGALWASIYGVAQSWTRLKRLSSSSSSGLFGTPWTAACQASLSITNFWSLLKLMSIESVIPSNHLILCYPLLLLPSIFHNIRVFSNESVLRLRWPKYWSFSFSISPPMNMQDWFPLGFTGLISSKELSWVFSNTTVQKHQFFDAQLSL